MTTARGGKSTNKPRETNPVAGRGLEFPHSAGPQIQWFGQRHHQQDFVIFMLHRDQPGRRPRQVNIMMVHCVFLLHGLKSLRTSLPPHHRLSHHSALFINTPQSETLDNIHTMTRDSESSAGDVGSQEKTWKRFVWDTLDKSPKERRFLLKLDLTLLTLGCLGMSAFGNRCHQPESGLTFWNRFLHQVPESGKPHQCVCVWHVSSLKSLGRQRGCLRKWKADMHAGKKISTCTATNSTTP